MPPQCPISYSLEIFGDRWTLQVLREVLLNGRFRYKELLGAVDGIATNVLAERLKRLDSRGLVRRMRDPDDARQYLYLPTELAVGVVPILVEMIVWGAPASGVPRDHELLRHFREDRDGLITGLQEMVRRNVAGLA